MKKRRKQEPEAVREIMEEGPSFTDPQGSWTGKPADELDEPVQDADAPYNSASRFGKAHRCNCAVLPPTKKRP